MKKIILLTVFVTGVFAARAQFFKKMLDGGVSAADSARAIQAYRSGNGGSGVFYQMVSVLTGKMNRRDTSSYWFTAGGEGRVEMTILGSGKMVTIGRLGLPTYSMSLDAGAKTYSLNVIDTSLLNSEKYTIEKLGTESVSGYPCTHVRLTSTIGSGTFAIVTSSEFWLSTAVPGYSILQHGMLEAGKNIGILKALHAAGADGIFLKMTARGKDYAMTMQLLQFKEGSFPSSLFVIPAGYHP